MVDKKSKVSKQVYAYESEDGKIFPTSQEAAKHSCRERFLDMASVSDLKPEDLDTIWKWMESNIHQLADDIINPLATVLDRGSSEPAKVETLHPPNKPDSW